MMKMHQVCGVLAVMALTAPAAEAQVTESFEQLGEVIELGGEVTVTNSAGQKLEARVIAVSPSSLGLLVAGTSFELDEADVRRIRQRRPDSLRNGGLIGFSVGAGFMAGMSHAFYAGEEYPRDAELGAVVLGAGLLGVAGFWIGRGVDALVVKEQVIYRGGGARPRATLVPALSPDRRGLALSIGW